MRQATNQLVYQNGHEPTPEELAKAMDMSVERVREIQRMAQEPASLESPVGEEEDSSLGDFVADENAEAPGKAADRAMVAQQINQALKSLTPREEKVIRLRFGLDDGRPRTLEEVGRDFGVTRERVRQIEAKAIRKLHSRKCLALLNGLIEYSFNNADGCRGKNGSRFSASGRKNAKCQIFLQKNACNCGRVYGIIIEL